jgi:hypothetical protein
MGNIYNVPSFYAHVINGILMLFAIILLYRNFSVVKRLEPYKQIMLALLFSMAIGIHGLTHFGLETVYGYNPMRTFLHP